MISNVTSLPNVEPLSLRDRLPARPAALAEDVLDSHVLLKGQREVLIRHGDKIYRLRHTSNDKLILTK
ncbi:MULTISPECIES: hemin uptake protein HemP [Pseudoxanthomonas]|jgi:hemin uptake protein HemP|uniref:hemin uptake protein HemP n=1 Tax=Pseudoxanthomonas TaxID=83618 RepID=UPI00160F7E9E|nr:MULTISPECIES: hemin uptake protein HemP [Pseudoxanthomonas]MBB3277831.1 hemin uptake protein HemP [Pseudoxanthomonas sp. OG2]MBD9375939.1 hemin uptake protein HemP [Pseudoxanthomonas sp. PXM04]MBV7474502.1 hemin uptake protein HemP [Pseudoxanthomonas sp. PXM05]UBB25945.1 hemin uptake protein HemP [Pseudoxanthomonas japonensis]